VGSKVMVRLRSRRAAMLRWMRYRAMSECHRNANAR
jgi:hypothetical protein